MHKRTKMNKNISAFSSVGLPTLFIYGNHPPAKKKKKGKRNVAQSNVSEQVLCVPYFWEGVFNGRCLLHHVAVVLLCLFFCLWSCFFASSSTFCLAAEEWRRPHQTEGCHSSSRGRSGGRSRPPPNPKLQYGCPRTMPMQQEDEQETKEEKAEG